MFINRLSAVKRSQRELISVLIPTLLLGVLVAVVVVELWGWAAAMTVLLASASMLAPVFLHRRRTIRFVGFFVLLATSDFLKRLVFLVPEQYLWSQYIVWLLPHFYYVFLLFIPWLVSNPKQVWYAVRYNGLVVAFIVLALLNTWLAPGFSVVARLAATGLLIMPWTMVLIASTTPDALTPVCKTLVVTGVVSTFYAFWQFTFGPTPVELNWAWATSEVSIGAQHLTVILEDTPGFGSVWRVIGLQADAFTFGMFSLTASVAALILYRLQDQEHRRFPWAIFVTGLGVVLSLVRTVWVSFVMFFMFAWAWHSFRFVRRPGVLLAALIGIFFAANLAAGILYSMFQLIPMPENNAVLQRILILGTLEARKEALNIFVSELPARWLNGFGYAASEWLASKFSSETMLPANFASHNALVELLWFLGVPGVVLFFALIYHLFKFNRKRWYAGTDQERIIRALLLAYVFAVFTSGLGNGSAFWGYYLFFFLGISLSRLSNKQKDL